MGHDHSAAAVSSAAKLIHGIARTLSVAEDKINQIPLFHETVTVTLTRQEYPHPGAAGNAPKGLRQPEPGISKSSRVDQGGDYTFPQEKQRTGIIIVTMRKV